MIDAWLEAPESIDDLYWDRYGREYLEEFGDCNCDLDEDRCCECPTFEEWLEDRLKSEACI